MKKDSKNVRIAPTHSGWKRKILFWFIVLVIIGLILFKCFFKEKFFSQPKIDKVQRPVRVIEQSITKKPETHHIEPIEVKSKENDHGSMATLAVTENFHVNIKSKSDDDKPVAEQLKEGI